MPKRSRGLGNNPLDDLTAGPATQEDTPARTETTKAENKAQQAQSPSPKKMTGGGRRWKRVMVYLDPETDGQWLNEVVGRARAEGLTQRQMGETEILRVGLAELQRLSWEELVERVTQRSRPPTRTDIAE